MLRRSARTGAALQFALRLDVLSCVPDEPLKLPPDEDPLEDDDELEADESDDDEYEGDEEDDEYDDPDDEEEDDEE